MVDSKLELIYSPLSTANSISLTFGAKSYYIVISWDKIFHLKLNISNNVFDKY